MKNILLLLALTGAALLFACNQPALQESPTSSDIKPKEEQHRPHFHFTPDSMWMNDPNGMVYYEGEYHLFYQYYPDANVWGPMHWGHAVSKDLVQWEHLPIAIYPDSLGYVFSGSAVIDWNNTSWFGKKENPAMVAIYTIGLEDDKKIPQKQAIAYSLDKGRTWTRYEGNPVLDEGLRAFRDPKVFWHEPAKVWVMSISATTDNIGIRPNHIRFYQSSNLKEWEKTGEFGHSIGSQEGNWECSDLFELYAEGTQKNKWILLVSINPGGPNGGSGTQYFIGDFDGKTFTPDDSVTRWLDYGTDNYAGVTWNGIPEEDGRRIFIGWMGNWQYAQVVPTERWRSAMTVPRQLKLVQAQDGYRLTSQPIRELTTLRKNEAQSIGSFDANESKSFDLQDGIGELILQCETPGNYAINLQNKEGELYKFVYEHRSNQFITDRTTSGKVDFNDNFPKKHIAQRHMEGEKHDLHILIDRASIEIFADGGITVITDIFFPHEDFDQVVISTNKEMKVSEGKFYLH